MKLRLRSLLQAALSRLNARLGIVATGDENDYYAWADIRLDALAEEARLTRQMADRGYRYVPGTIHALRVSGAPDDEQVAS